VFASAGICLPRSVPFMLPYLTVSFFDYQFDSLQSLTRLGIIPVAHADQGGAVFLHQPFGPSLLRFIARRVFMLELGRDRKRAEAYQGRRQALCCFYPCCPAAFICCCFAAVLSRFCSWIAILPLFYRCFEAALVFSIDCVKLAL
jgi:hypothetical protein